MPINPFKRPLHAHNEHVEHPRQCSLNNRNLLDVFIHIPKTGGSCVRTVLARNYGNGEIFGFDGPVKAWRHFLETKDGYTSKTRMLHGHVPYGVADGLAREARYATILRDPISRLVSDYLFALTPESGYHGDVVKSAMSFRDFCFGMNNLLSNAQSKWIAGIHPLEGVDIDENDLRERALRALSQYHVVGINEYLPETMLLMARCFGWKPPVFHSVNISPMSGALRAALTEKIRSEIAKNNAVDIEIYGIARRRFQELLMNEGPSFWLALEEIKRAAEKLDAGKDAGQLKKTFVIGRDAQTTDDKVYPHTLSFIRDTEAKGET